MNSSRILAALVAAVALSLGLGSGRAADIYWTNTLGGDWTDALSWSPNQVPGTNDSPFITASGTYTVTMHSVAVRNLIVGGPSGTQTVVLGGGGFANAIFDGDVLFASNTILNVTSGLGTSVYGNARITIHGQMNLTGSVGFSEAIAITIATNGILNMSGAYQEFSGVITNAGRITWSGEGSIAVGSGFKLYNLVGGVFDVQNDQMMYSDTGGGNVQNAGLFRKSAGSGTTTFYSLGFFNTGTVEVETGLLRFTSGGFVQTAGALLLNGGNVSPTAYLPFIAGGLPFRGGLLAGSGQIQTDVKMSGQLSPGLSAGLVTIQGNYVQTPAGSCNIEIGGTIAGTNYDQVIVTNHAALAGTINVISINGFVPALGDRFEIMKFGSMSGSVTFHGLDITNGVYLQPVFSPTNLVLVATAAPLQAAPKMNLARNGDSLWLWWPLGYGAFNVQSTTNLNSPIPWSPVTPAEINRHIFTPAGPAKFFQMVGP